MIEIINKYSEDLGSKIPESLLLIDKYEDLFKKVNQLTQLNKLKKLNDNYKYSKYK